jgi:adenine-specific DNA-methyltransferase
MPFLDWVNKAQATQVAAAVPYHLLEFQSAHGDGNAANLLIQGDNLLALKALLPFYRGQVKCIYIDPPYNTQSAFEHYDDKLEHSQWLSMMHPRMVLLRELLAEDGSIWVSIDDREAHYLKVLMDEVFGRENFVTTIAWQQRTTRENRKTFSSNHEFLLLYARSYPRFSATRNDLHLTEEVKARYKNPDEDPRGPWQSVSANAQAGHGTLSQFYTLVAPNGKQHNPPKGTCWRYTQEKMSREITANNIWFGKDGNGVPRIKKFLSEAKTGLTPETLWFAEDVGTNDFAKKHLIELFRDTDLFDTPKPESLISQVIQIATNPNDLVLDSFLGSGTTAAVAHKMGRRWIGIEMGEHAVTHCLPRLEKVGAGETGGISAAVGWQGGGGFRFHTLGELVFDAEGGINPAVRFTSLAAYLWHFETGQPAAQVFDSPRLGVHEGTAYYLFYNGILGDRRPAGGNVLTSNVLAHLDALLPHTGPRVIYGETTRLGEARLREAGITFKQIPYDIKAR